MESSSQDSKTEFDEGISLPSDINDWPRNQRLIYLSRLPLSNYKLMALTGIHHSSMGKVRRVLAALVELPEVMAGLMESRLSFHAVHRIIEKPQGLWAVEFERLFAESFMDKRGRIQTLAVPKSTNRRAAHGIARLQTKCEFLIDAFEPLREGSKRDVDRALKSLADRIRTILKSGRASCNNQ